MVASRLSETGASVLVLEAGEDAPPESAVPGLSSLLRFRKNDWEFKASKSSGVSLLGLLDRVSHLMLNQIDVFLFINVT